VGRAAALLADVLSLVRVLIELRDSWRRGRHGGASEGRIERGVGGRPADPGAQTVAPPESGGEPPEGA